MRRKFLFLVMLLTMILGFANLKEAGAQTINKLDIYYYRYDNFQNHDAFAWMWSTNDDAKLGTDGIAKQVKADSTGFGYKATFNIPEKALNNKFGLLFCEGKTIPTDKPGFDGEQPSWGGQQTANMYFYLKDLQVNNQGVAEVFFVQGEQDVATTKEVAKEQMHQKFEYLSFINSNTIAYTTFGVDPSDVTVYADGQLIEATLSHKDIKLTEKVDLNKEYRVKCNMGPDKVDQVVTLDGIYSSDYFNEHFGYEGNDLGANYQKQGTTFKLWAPISNEITLNLYNYGHPTTIGTTEYPGDDKPFKEVSMTRGDLGVWTATVEEDLDGKYYTYTVKNGKNINEVVDPYAKATGVNGLRGMVVNFDKTNDKLNPSNWATAQNEITYNNNVDKVIYEAHVRDLTADATWGGKKEWAGTFMGLSQEGTTYKENGVTVTTGLDHLKELGITHLHVLPVMENEIIDETRLNDPEYKKLDFNGVYNWGYMTRLFFSVDGSFSTNPYDGYQRLYEYKTMIAALHENNINLIMDVVFNHTSTSGDNPFQKIVPNYYYRTVNGAFSNGSGCGNEVASERFMVNKLIKDSVSYFADEFKVDGFRFDLMGLEDVNTMNDVYNTVSAIDEDTIIYGEPWSGGSSTNTYMPANKGNMHRMPNVGAFVDVVRDSIKGKNDPNKGWVTDLNYTFDGVAYGIVGSQRNFNNSVGTDYTFRSPNQAINYVSCHDNFSLYDQIQDTTKWSPTRKNKEIMNAVSQSLSIVLTSQGVPFIEGGSELGRTKPNKDQTGLIKGHYNHNSYNASDEVNVIHWDKKVKNKAYVDSICNLIKIRKEHHAFRQATYEDIKLTLGEQNMYYNEGKTIAYRIRDNYDSWNDIYVIHANSLGAMNFVLPESTNGNGWEIVYSNSNPERIGSFAKGNIKVGNNESLIIVGNADKDITLNPEVKPAIPHDQEVEAIKAKVDYCLGIIFRNNVKLESYSESERKVLVKAATDFMSQTYNSLEAVEKSFNAYLACVKEILK